MTFSNYHTHTLLCDGKADAEAIVQTALSLGCSEIGFSGHGYTDFDESYCMSEENEKKYKETVLSLKEKYKGKINVLLGIEKDVYSDREYDDYDYVIGGVHYIKAGGRYYDVDESKEQQLLVISNCFGGDPYAFCEAYYENVAKLYEKTKCDIVAHFDLVTKFNEDGSIFDTKNERYLRAVDRALDALSSCPVMFEINTGAISRGYRTTPYPEQSIINKIKSRGKSLLLSSDAHRKEDLLFGFEEFKHLL